ncbi:MAG: hypothetical protein V2A78_09155 [bacterium]
MSKMNTLMLNQDIPAGQPWSDVLSGSMWIAFGVLFLVSLLMVFKNLSSMKKGKTYYRYSMYTFIIMAFESLLFLIYGLIISKCCDYLLNHETFTRVFFISFSVITTLLILICFVFVFKYLQDLRKACKDSNMTLWQSFFKEP